MNVGFVGLGVMGLPMATNLANAGHRLKVNDLRRDRAASLLALGAAWADDARAAAEEADVVITIVPDSPEVVAAATGPDGLLAGCRAGTVWIDMSSISPVTARELAVEATEAGVAMLDAPVSGGQTGAVAGELSIMVGGPADVLARVRPLLEQLGKTIVHVGDGVGSGQVAKACNQMVVGITIGAVAEALVVARKSGVDPARIRDALLGGFAQSRILELHGRRMLDGAFEPGFRIRLHQKDLAIATAMARTYSSPAPLSALALELMNAAAAAGFGDDDHAAVALVYERLADAALAG